MSQISIPSAEQGISLPAMWQKSLKTSRFLSWLVIGSIILFLLTIVLNIVDSRVVTGAPVWIKPMKFAISIVLYSGTLIWMLGFIEGKRRLVNVIAIGTTAGFFVEYVAIFIQAGRGVRSHFNFSTPFDAMLFNFMGAFVIIVWILNLLTAYLLIRQKMENKPFAWAIRLGLLITAFGAGLGFVMTSVPTPAQQAELESGNMPAFLGAHSVGVEDGGAGLPFTGWSVEGGDLRVPHFFGMHALQIIPLLGIVVNRLFSARLSENRRNVLVWTGGFGYLALTAVLLWQALRGQPVIAPDALTLAALAGIMGAIVVSVTAVFTIKEG